jgi:peptidoglycan-associated lipoprotein
MRQSVVAAALVVALFAAVSGCHKTPPKAPPPPPPPAPATPPPAPAPPPTTPPVDEYTRIKNMDTAEIDKLGLFADIRFEFDKADLRESDRQTLAKNADNLKKFDFLKVKVEGHADERGTVEYNLALGERRAKASYDYLVSLGVPAQRLTTVSYGKEVPLCTEHSEDCWARNRRDHFAVTGKTTP